MVGVCGGGGFVGHIIGDRQGGCGTDAAVGFFDECAKDGGAFYRENAQGLAASVDSLTVR